MILAVDVKPSLMTRSGQEARPERIVFRWVDSPGVPHHTRLRWWTQLDGSVCDIDGGPTDFDFNVPDLTLPTLHEIRRHLW